MAKLKQFVWNGILITLVSTVLVFGVGGLVTEMLMKKKEEKIHD